MKWTKQAPTEPGWWWVRYMDGQRKEVVAIAQTERRYESLNWRLMSGVWQPMTFRKISEWAGPIEPPEEP